LFNCTKCVVGVENCLAAESEIDGRELSGKIDKKWHEIE
jgi:hypothetical protein